ncbi:PD-(D/E)XK nuclease family protein [Paenibacillus sp. MMS20-IR301]|uniref:PD-(D/E)XK nuclease family protein n=1 Tax=Paenibacillus sp. MMS20-IR301 TaxID=2895946 RepID=UPI0028F0CBBA|nr:PD-(D/E)XK nuclease family protein [Paenibacillus sp. MMS20-IR301]WNS42374.1 PD-(D/E)XK nuclease family protein [Paenibacillus sp. MMS20-IR301]
MTGQSLIQKLFYLVSDEHFAQIENLAKRPNLFNIVGRTHTETWHSMFLGWLLDPQGSHNLKDYSLKRFLVAVSNPTVYGEDAKLDEIARVASICDLKKANVYPNQEIKKEFSCPVGKMDVFIEIEDIEHDLKVIILLEQKVNAKIDNMQCKKYLDWVKSNYPNYFIIPVLLAPSHQINVSSEKTLGSSEWYCIDYQLLHDKVLTPIARNPELNPQVNALITQYIDVLKIPYNGRKLAVTDEEKELALELYSKHREAFEAIQAALSDSVDISLIPTTSEISKLMLYANGKKIDGSRVPEFYLKGLQFIINNSFDLEKITPFETSSKRYLVNTEPKHPNGNPFTVPVSYNGYYIEAHKSREQAIKDLAKLLKALNMRVSLEVDPYSD